MKSCRWLLAFATICLLAGGIHFTSSEAITISACILAFAFFYISLLPDSLLGFALTASQWMTVFSTAFDKSSQWSKNDIARAAARSCLSLSLLVTLTLIGATSGEARDADFARQSWAIAAGLEAGLLLGWFAVTFTD